MTKGNLPSFASVHMSIDWEHIKRTFFSCSVCHLRQLTVISLSFIELAIFAILIFLFCQDFLHWFLHFLAALWGWSPHSWHISSVWAATFKLSTIALLNRSMQWAGFMKLWLHLSVYFTSFGNCITDLAWLLQCSNMLLEQQAWSVWCVAPCSWHTITPRTASGWSTAKSD